MSPSELEEHLFQEPFIPLRITLASGDVVVIDNPRRAVIAGLSLYYAIADDPATRVGKKGKLMSIPNIVMVEAVDSHPRRNGRRRR
jgi:hypothetical protein